MTLFIGSQRASALDAMPLGKAPSTTRRGRVLRDEHGMPAKWCLLAIVPWLGGREPLGDEGRGMLQHRRQTPGFEIFLLSRAEPKASPKGRTTQRDEQIVEVSHDVVADGR